MLGCVALLEGVCHLGVGSSQTQCLYLFLLLVDPDVELSTVDGFWWGADGEGHTFPWGTAIRSLTMLQWTTQNGFFSYFFWGVWVGAVD